MDFEALAKERYSLRRFDPRPVEPEKLQKLLEICREVPTAVNYQPQRLLVLQSPTQLEKLKDCTRYHFHAPLAILVCYDTQTSWKRSYDGKDSGYVDASIVGTYLMMAAVELGLGSTWVMSFDPAALRKAYAIPDGLEPVALFPMGYAADNAKPADFHFSRKPLQETVFYEDFSSWKAD